MKIVGVLIWYDEPASWLAKCVAGFARLCDHIVAVDGGYALYPAARSRSLPNQAEAVMGDWGCTIVRPGNVFFGNEVEKRNYSLRLAAAENPDWVVVFDADYIVDDRSLFNPDIIRAELAATEHHCATYTLLDGQDLMANDRMAAAARELPLSTEWTLRDRGIFRWTDDLRYGPAHYCVRGTYDGEETWLRGPDLMPDQQHKACDVLHLGRNLVVVHRRQYRPKVRLDAADVYYKMREAAGAEIVTAETLYGSAHDAVAA